MTSLEPSPSWAAARFIVFEGGEGCGKSTQAARLATALGAVLTREPGGTTIGAAVRGLLLDPGTVDLDPVAEALLMAADRAQHLAEVVRPALAAGRHVVSDRFVGSSIAYQGYGRELGALVAQLNRPVVTGTEPDLVLLLDVPPDVAAGRLDRDLDRFEQEDGGFHARVRAGFRAQADADPGRWAVIDATGTIDDVESAVRAVVRERLQLLP